MKCYEKFIPVITIVVYYGTKKMWDGARTLHELLDMGDHEELIKPYISNYRLNLYDFHEEDSFDRFQTELGTLFEFLRYSTDRSALLQRMEQNPERYSHVDRETSRLITKLTGIKELKETQDETTEGEVNMCKAFEDMKLEGQKITTINQIKKKLAKGISAPEIADMLELDTEYVGEAITLINKYPDENIEQLAERLSYTAISL